MTTQESIEAFRAALNNARSAIDQAARIGAEVFEGTEVERVRRETARVMEIIDSSLLAQVDGNGNAPEKVARSRIGVIRVVLPAAASFTVFFLWLVTRRWPDVTALGLAIVLLWSIVPLGGIVAVVGFILDQRSSVWRAIGNVLLAIAISYPFWFMGWVAGQLLARWLASGDIAIDVLEPSARFASSFIEDSWLPYAIALVAALVRMATIAWPLGLPRSGKTAPPKP